MAYIENHHGSQEPMVIVDCHINIFRACRGYVIHSYSLFWQRSWALEGFFQSSYKSRVRPSVEGSCALSVQHRGILWRSLQMEFLDR
jgi:hypothetical protein